MIFPPSFYFLEKLESSIYSQEPPGYLKVSRLIRNQAPWKKCSMTGEKKPKSLILADWTAEQWSAEKIHDVQAKLTLLFDQGFCIYLWQRRKLVLFNQDQLHLLKNKSFRKNITSDVPPVIIDAAFRQQQLAQSQIKILDDYGIDCLLSANEALSPRHLSIKELLETVHHKELILDFIERSIPPLKEIIYDEYSGPANQLLLKIHGRYPSIRILRHYRSLMFDQTMSESILYSNIPKITGDELAEIENFSMSICCRINSEQYNKKIICDLLVSSRNLRTLDLQHCNILVDFITHIPLSNLVIFIAPPPFLTQNYTVC